MADQPEFAHQSDGSESGGSCPVWAIPPSCARMHKAEPYTTSHRAERDGLLQGRHGVFERDKLASEIAFEFQVGDGLCDGAPVEFLGFVEFVAAGDAAGVEV